MDNRSSDKLKSILKIKTFNVKKGKEDASESSNTNEIDPFFGYYNTTSAPLGIINPPIDCSVFTQIRDLSSEIGPDVDAMKVNIERTGWRIEARPKTGIRNEDLPANIKAELAEVENFFNNCVLDQEIGSFRELRSRSRDDLEISGMFYVEVLGRSNEPLHPAGLKHVPSWTMRITNPDYEFTTYRVPRAIKGPTDEDWTIEDMYASKRFRRFVQLNSVNDSQVWFKEWNDPRRISKRDGRVISEENQNLEDEEAHEIIFKRIYASGTPYGKPRWYGATLSVYGSRGAEEINYVSLDNNQIPALALLATNVAITEGSLDKLQEFFEKRIQGDRNYSRIVIIEAEPIGEGMKDPGSMKMQLEHLAKDQHDDAMFKEYIPLCDARIRRSWRLPPLMVGASEDYTKATATASKLVAEQQVFVPERLDIDELWTTTIIARLRKAYVVLKSNSPELTDGFELTQLLATAEGSGGLSPRVSRKIVEDVMNMDLSEPDSSIEPDIPFSLTKLREQARLFQIAQESTANPNVKKSRDDEIIQLLSLVANNDKMDVEIKNHIIALTNSLRG